MKVLLVDDFDKYAAEKFEKIYDTKEKKKKVFEKAISQDNNLLTIDREFINYAGRKEKVSFAVTAYDFDKVDPKFVELIRDKVQDRDFAMQVNFYVIEED